MMGTWINQLTFAVCGSKDISDTLSRSAGWCQLNLSVMGEGAAAISRGRKSWYGQRQHANFSHRWRPWQCPWTRARFRLPQQCTRWI